MAFSRRLPSAFRSLTQAASRRASSLVVASHNNERLGDAVGPAVTAAGELGGDITVLVAGKGCAAPALQASKMAGVTKVLVADDDIYDNGLAECLTALITKCQQDNGYSHIVAGSDNYGKNVLPRVAGVLKASQISDVMQVNSATQFVRPMYAGNAIATVESVGDPVTCLTIRTASFAAPEETGSAPVESIGIVAHDGPQATFVERMASDSSGPTLTSASRVVSGGRGMKDGKHFDILYSLAGELGDCAVGASRAAVDSGFCSNDLQVGQTGKVVAPDLYIACGISGAIQHLAGMKDSKTIVCVNKDSDAPIFQVADYGLQADLFDAVPEMTSKLASVKA